MNAFSSGSCALGVPISRVNLSRQRKMFHIYEFSRVCPDSRARVCVKLTTAHDEVEAASVALAVTSEELREHESLPGDDSIPVSVRVCTPVVRVQQGMLRGVTVSKNQPVPITQVQTFQLCTRREACSSVSTFRVSLGYSS